MSEPVLRVLSPEEIDHDIRPGGDTAVRLFLATQRALSRTLDTAQVWGIPASALRDACLGVDAP